MKRLAYLSFLLSIFLTGCLPKESVTILIQENASPLEQMAAKEIRRYVYLRTGKLLPIKDKVSGGSPTIEIVVNSDLDDQEFSLKRSFDSVFMQGAACSPLL